MSNIEDKLNGEQISEIVRQLIKKVRGNINIDKHGDFYGWLQRIASDLNYIEKPKFTQIILSHNDTKRCVEIIWEYVLKGILTPGSSSDGYNLFFPYLHLTEKGKKEIEKW